MSGRVFLLGVGLALVALAFALTDRLLAPRGGVTAANVQRVLGLTLREAKAILGDSPHMLPSDASQTGYIWVSRGGCASVYFNNRTQRAEAATFADANDPSTQHAIRFFGCASEPGPFARLRALLGW
jgi:hypothetical protein